MIRLFVIAAAFLIICAGLASAQSGSQKAAGRTESALMQIERDIGKANIRRDKAYFERIEADEFIFTDSAGGTTTKAEDLASLDKPAGNAKLISYEADQMKVNLYDKTAVVTGRVTSVYRVGDKESTIRNRFTDVFVKRNGRWQIAAGHSSRIREPQK